MSKLAIIIPAYKVDFLPDVFESLASQTNKDFTVYVGDDNSPYDIAAVVERFSGKLNVKYTHFDSNIGGNDLVSQWERCIRLSQTEEWIWLFSDDDVMEPDCIQKFYETVESTGGRYDVYHLDVKVIDSNGNIIRIPNPYPDVYYGYAYYHDKMLGKVGSWVVENVFKRSVWERTGGFQNFDLAWGSDTASWIKFMQYTGMYTVRGAYIHWRQSDQNISPNHSEDISLRKMNALINYYNWAYDYFVSKGQGILFVSVRTYIRRMRSFKKYVPYRMVKKCNQKFCRLQHIPWMKPLLDLYIKFR